MNSITIFTLPLFFIIGSLNALSQNNVVISDKDTVPHQSSILHLISEDKGLLITRIDGNESIVDPVESLIIFNKEKYCFQIFLEGDWHDIFCPEEPWQCGDPYEYNDYDYATVKIGDQCWFAEDLKTTKFNDGTDIPHGESDEDWEAQSDAEEPAYCWHSNDESLSSLYGALYNHYTIYTEKLCPEGWRVATDDDWKELEMFAGMSESEANGTGYRGTDEAKKLKACRQREHPHDECDISEHPRWNSHHSAYGIDEFGFAGLPGGYRMSSGTFYWLGSQGQWWSPQEGTTTSGRMRRLHRYYDDIQRSTKVKGQGLLIRCIQN